MISLHCHHPAFFFVELAYNIPVHKMVRQREVRMASCADSHAVCYTDGACMRILHPTCTHQQMKLYVCKCAVAACRQGFRPKHVVLSRS
jgi:hypothetical protein